MNRARIYINDQIVELTDSDKIPFSIKFGLESVEDFERKVGSESFGLEIPASLRNSRVAGGVSNPSVLDLTDGKVFRSVGSCCVEINGYEVLNGKAFLNSGKHTRVPTSYSYSLFGDNAAWVIDLKEKTIFDLIQHINFQFTKTKVVESWAYDGRDENLPYLFAPVRYREKFGEDDKDMPVDYMRPSISPYWIIYWALKSIGYSIKSKFFDTNYFRRQTLPWMWGNFLVSEGTRQDNLDFLAKSTEKSFYYLDYVGYVDLLATNDSSEGAFDNNGSYNYNSGTNAMEWTYLTAFNYGNLDVTLKVILDFMGSRFGNSHQKSYLRWFKNGVQIQEDIIWESEGDMFSLRVTKQDLFELYCTVNVDAGDVISVRVYVDQNETTWNSTQSEFQVLEFGFEYFRIPLGGIIDFKNYNVFKNYKFLDLLRGLTDVYDLAYSTDTTLKVVTIEPHFPYSLNNNLAVTSEGFIRNTIVDWTKKQDLAEESVVETYSEGERELSFRFKDDPNDGGLKTIQDRYSVVLGRGKYVLPSRFKSGTNEKENRFFSPVMHYDVDQWKEITGTAPQMIALIPENVSNTSRNESESTLLPKLAYYKGFDYTMGWRFDGEDLDYFPYMFAVNYQPGGHNDPILSYSDELIGNPIDGFTIGKGLLKRFFWQRLAVMRNGQYYNTQFRLKHFDAAGQHRDYKVIRGNRYELVNLEYFPLRNESAKAVLRKWEPVSEEDLNSTYPSEAMLLTGSNATDGNDVKYSTMKLLNSDVK